MFLRVANVVPISKNPHVVKRLTSMSKGTRAGLTKCQLRRIFKAREHKELLRALEQRRLQMPSGGEVICTGLRNSLVWFISQ